GDGANFIKTIVAVASSRESVSVVNDQWGLPTFAEDLAPALVALASVPGAAGMFHIAGAGPAGNWAEVAEIALAAAGSKAEVYRTSTAEYYAGKSGPIAPRPTNSVLDCSKASSMGIAMRPWRQAVVAYVQTGLIASPQEL
ncbi:MAG: sugar nucleotide-binding protein, partial [Actinomycetota bacterium]